MVEAGAIGGELIPAAAGSLTQRNAHRSDDSQREAVALCFAGVHLGPTEDVGVPLHAAVKVGHGETRMRDAVDRHVGSVPDMPYHPMSDEEVAAFLATEPPHTAKVATTRKDGSPHLAPVWFALDGEA